MQPVINSIMEQANEARRIANIRDWTSVDQAPWALRLACSLCARLESDRQRPCVPDMLATLESRQKIVRPLARARAPRDSAAFARGDHYGAYPQCSWLRGPGTRKDDHRRRPTQRGHSERTLQENANSSSWPQSSQRIRAKLRPKIPHSENRRQLEEPRSPRDLTWFRSSSSMVASLRLPLPKPSTLR